MSHVRDLSKYAVCSVRQLQSSLKICLAILGAVPHKIFYESGFNAKKDYTYP